MSIKTENKIDIAYKRLAGLANTNPLYGTNNETIASNVQLGSFQIFGDSIDQNPDNAAALGIARKSIFKLQVVDSGIRDGKNYVWKLLKYNSLTDEWTPYSGQLIPASFGLDYYPKIYSTYVGSGDTDFNALDPAQEISKNSESNWLIDCFASILVFQDLETVMPTDQWVVVAYEYTGKYLDEVVGSGGGSGGGNTGSGHRTITSTPKNNDFPPQKTSLDIGNDELFLLDAVNSNIEIELPLASENQNKKIKFKRIDDTSTDNYVYIHGFVLSDPIGGSTYQFIDDRGGQFQAYEAGTNPPIDKGIYLHVQYETITLYCDGNKWHII